MSLVVTTCTRLSRAQPLGVPMMGKLQRSLPGVTALQ